MSKEVVETVELESGTGFILLMKYDNERWLASHLTFIVKMYFICNDNHGFVTVWQ